MKDIPVEVTDKLNDRANIRPTFLIVIELGETLHLTTMDADYVYEDTSYIAGQIVGDVQISQDQASFGLVNVDYQYTTPALTGVYQRAPVKIWWTDNENRLPPLIEPGYVDDDYYIIPPQREPILLFDGHVSHFDQITSVLGIVASRSAARRYPTLRVLPPIANYVAPEGTVITLGGNTYRLESRNS